METVSVSKWISDSNMKLLQKARIKSVWHIIIVKNML